MQSLTETRPVTADQNPQVANTVQKVPGARGGVRGEGAQPRLDDLATYADAIRSRIKRGRDYPGICKELHGAQRMALALGNEEASELAQQLVAECVAAWKAQDERQE